MYLSDTRFGGLTACKYMSSRHRLSIVWALHDAELSRIYAVSALWVWAYKILWKGKGMGKLLTDSKFLVLCKSLLWGRRRRFSCWAPAISTHFNTSLESLISSIDLASLDKHGNDYTLKLIEIDGLSYTAIQVNSPWTCLLTLIVKLARL